MRDWLDGNRRRWRVTFCFPTARVISIAACALALALLGASPAPTATPTPTPTSTDAMLSAYAILNTSRSVTGIVEIASLHRVYAILAPESAGSGTSAGASAGSLETYDTQTLNTEGSIAVCSRPTSIVADALTERVVVGCTDTFVVIDGRSLRVIAIRQVALRAIAAGGARSPFAYALIDNGAIQIDTVTGTIIPLSVPAREYDELSVAGGPHDRVTLYDESSATTVDAVSMRATVHQFGRRRYPLDIVSVDGADVVALSGAGSLARLSPDGPILRIPACDTPSQLFSIHRPRRIIAVCSSTLGAKVSVVSMKSDGSDRRITAVSDASVGDGPSLPGAPHAVLDSMSSRLVVLAANMLHVIDCATAEELYTVAVPGFSTGLAIDSASGDAVASFSNDQSGGGLVRFNARLGKPTAPTVLGGASRPAQQQGLSVAVMTTDFPPASPARSDPPGLRSPTDLVVLGDGSLLVRELFAPRVGHFHAGVYAEERLAFSQAPSAMVAGCDGHVWFAETSDGVTTVFARRNDDGTLTEYPVLSLVLRDLVASGDGLYWIANFRGSKSIGHLSYDGHFSLVSIPSDDGFGEAFVSQVAGDPAGGFWIATELSARHFDARGRSMRSVKFDGLAFLESARLSVLDDGRLTIARLTRLDVVERNGIDHLYFPQLGFPPPPFRVGPINGDVPTVSMSFSHLGEGQCALKEVAAGPAHTLWGLCRGAIVSIASDGLVRRYALKFEQSSPTSLVRGPDGSMWFAEPTQSRLGRITPDGELHEIDI